MSQKSSSRLTYIKSISLEIDYLEFVAEKGDNSLGKAGCWLASLEKLSSQIKLNCQLFIFLALHTWGRGFWLKHDALTQITNNARSHMSLINWWVILLSYLTASRHTEMQTFSYSSYNNTGQTTLKYRHKLFHFCLRQRGWGKVQGILSTFLATEIVWVCFGLRLLRS